MTDDALRERADVMHAHRHHNDDLALMPCKCFWHGHEFGAADEMRRISASLRPGRCKKAIADARRPLVEARKETERLRLQLDKGTAAMDEVRRRLPEVAENARRPLVEALRRLATIHRQTCPNLATGKKCYELDVADAALRAAEGGER